MISVSSVGWHCQLTVLVNSKCIVWPTFDRYLAPTLYCLIMLVKCWSGIIKCQSNVLNWHWTNILLFEDLCMVMQHQTIVLVSYWSPNIYINLSKGQPLYLLDAFATSAWSFGGRNAWSVCSLLSVLTIWCAYTLVLLDFPSSDVTRHEDNEWSISMWACLSTNEAFGIK